MTLDPSRVLTLRGSLPMLDYTLPEGGDLVCTFPLWSPPSPDRAWPQWGVIHKCLHSHVVGSPTCWFSTLGVNLDDVVVPRNLNAESFGHVQMVVAGRGGEDMGGRGRSSSVLRYVGGRRGD